MKGRKLEKSHFHFFISYCGLRVPSGPKMMEPPVLHARALPRRSSSLKRAAFDHGLESGADSAEVTVAETRYPARTRLLPKRQATWPNAGRGFGDPQSMHQARRVVLQTRFKRPSQLSPIPV